MHELDGLRQLFEFRRQELALVPILSTLLAGVAITAAAVLLGGAERSRLRAYLVFGFTASTLVLIFGTLIDTTLLAAMGAPGVTENADKMRGFNGLSRVAVWSVLAGVLGLLSSVGLLGFLHSRRVGTAIAATAGALLVGFVVFCIVLDRVMRMS
ncbi:MAG: hypothetical protein RBS39_13035 [Phycisphaerales bacterium]|jgi:hypothetical protein|nr:hypothetical protein [Phycisphaerales bacterium]